MRRPIILMAAVMLSLGMAILGMTTASASTQHHAATPASASASASQGMVPLAESQCGESSFCGWENVNYSGPSWRYNANLIPTGHWHPISDCSNKPVCLNANDKISSIDNNRKNVTLIGRDSTYDGASHCIKVDVGIAYASIGGKWPDGTQVNDSISSFKLTVNPDWRTISGCSGLIW